MHSWLRLERPFPYEEFIVQRYDLPVLNGSRAFIMYKTANTSVFVVESESPCLFLHRQYHLQESTTSQLLHVQRHMT